MADVHGMTPLHWVAERSYRHASYVATAELLIEHGADPTLRDEQGRTPADVATQTGATTLAQCLRRSAGPRRARGPRAGRAGEW
jgi:ankyrin repeat protein